MEMERDEDLQSHFESSLCTKGRQACKTLQLRIASLCNWYSSNISRSNITTQTKHTTYSVFYELITTNYQDLAGYYSYLADVRKFKASTICNYNEDVSYFANWFVSLRRTRNVLYTLSPHDLHSIHIVINAMRKCYRKYLLKERSAAPTSICELINRKKWPIGGLQELYDAVVAELSWLSRLLEHNYTASRNSYGNFMELLVSSAYVCSIQGRVQALNELQLKDYDALLNGYFMSSTFKTSQYFGLQPVTTSDLFRYLLKIYIEKFRTRTSHNLPSDPLFLSYDNTPLRVGRYVTRFFKRTLNLHITTNSIRSIVETSAEDLHLSGVISNEERNSILNINGHSNATMRKYYLKRNRERDITHATEVFDKTVPNRDCSPISPNSLSFNVKHNADTFAFDNQRDLCLDSSSQKETDTNNCNTFTDYRESNYGRTCNHSITHATQVFDKTVPNRDCSPISPNSLSFKKHTYDTNTGWKHEYFGRTNLRRIPWSTYELDYISKWCFKHGNANNVMANCLENIRSDKEALQYFHPHHIRDSARLRYGYEIWKRQNGINC
jgi:hypothetical protein